MALALVAIVRHILSATPFCCGEYGAEDWSVTPCFIQTALNEQSLPMNTGSLSLWIVVDPVQCFNVGRYAFRNLSNANGALSFDLRK
jgi:hypothetical protein